MQYKDIDSKAQALLELNNVFDLFSLIRQDNVLIILSDNGNDGEFTVRVMDSTQKGEESTSNIIAQGVISMLEEDPDVMYVRGVKAAEEEHINYGENVIPFSIKGKNWKGD